MTFVFAFFSIFELLTLPRAGVVAVGLSVALVSEFLGELKFGLEPASSVRCNVSVA